jgi:hypothetical protein
MKIFIRKSTTLLKDGVKGYLCFLEYVLDDNNTNEKNKDQ